MSGRQADVLVVGAGPTGLALALQAHDHGASVQVIERRGERFRPSRAMVMHPRTLEMLRPRGVTDLLLGRGDPAASIQLHLGSRLARVHTADLDLSATEFPHLLLIRQAAVESVLSQAVAERGIVVERGCELTGLDPKGPQPCATLTRAGIQERVPYRYLVGCDGADSTVRTLAGIGWPGSRYHEEVVLADVELTSALTPEDAHVFAGRSGVLFLFGLGELASWRLLATRTASEPTSAKESVGLRIAELQALLDDAGVQARITDVGWSTRISPERRLASRYRLGRLFLAGDAAHTHSPAAAQGMNTGIQDGLNLGWKLAVSARSSHLDVRTSLLLDSYEIERRPIAREVLGFTSAMFWAEASAHPAARLLRGLAPLAAPALPFALRDRRVLVQALQQLSQFRVRYRHSPLSVEAAPFRSGPKAGDRLPDGTVTVEGRPRRLHELVSPPGIHVLLQRDALPQRESDLLERCWSGQRLYLHRVTSWAGEGAILIRPDGYLGLRSVKADVDQLRQWLQLIAVCGDDEAHASTRR